MLKTNSIENGDAPLKSEAISDRDSRGESPLCVGYWTGLPLGRELEKSTNFSALHGDYLEKTCLHYSYKIQTRA